jgi:hypothetical protein
LLLVKNIYRIILLFLLPAYLVAQTKTSTKTGSWSDPTLWTPIGIPASTDKVIIASNHSVSINLNASCDSLIVGTGTGAAQLKFSGPGSLTLTVNNLLVRNLATFNVQTIPVTTHVMNISGNITNNGTFDMRRNANDICNVNFIRNGNQTVSGTGSTTRFVGMTLNMGASSSNILEISSSSFVTQSNFLTLANGTLKVSTPNVTIVPFPATTTISSKAGMWFNSLNGSLTFNDAVTLIGELRVTNGVVTIGNAINEDLTVTGGTLAITDGSLNIAGKYNATSAATTFSMTGGTLTAPTFGSSNTTIAPFHLSNAGSQFIMTGGSIIIQSEGGSGVQDLGYVNTVSSSTVTGGTLQLGNSLSSASQTISINSVPGVGNLVVSSSNVTAKCLSGLNILNDVTVSSGILNANNFSMVLGGSWSDAGTFVPGTGTVTFSSSISQTLMRTGGETFGNLIFAGSGTKSFLSIISTSGNFSISTGAAVDVSTSNYALTVNGNLTNNGSFNARNGLVTMSGTNPQQINGSGLFDLYDLTINNPAGASLASDINLYGSLTLSNGIFNLNGQNFTLMSNSLTTARIAEITGTGDISGSVTVQRFIPGGSTGWLLMGSPMSTGLTMNDWDDDLYITCPTCPDGFPGGFYSIYQYDESAPGLQDDPLSYIPVSSVNDPILPGTGYWVYAGTSQFTTTGITVDVTGDINKFNSTMPLSYSNFGLPFEDGWNLIHNPYPSPISWRSLLGTTGNVDNAIYVYNADLNGGTGAYATYINGISSPAVSSGGIGDEIAMSQGFFVHCTGPATLIAQESNKVSVNATFLKSAPLSPPALARIKLSSFNGIKDEAVLYFQQGATDNFDMLYDSYKLKGSDPGAPAISLEKNGVLFQVNGISPVSGTFTIGLKTLTGYTGSYTIHPVDMSTFPKGACFTLFDRFTGTTTDLVAGPHIFNLIDTTTIARFVLTVKINHLNILSTLQQPDCSKPSNGMVIAAGLSTGPWNYYWKVNGAPVQTSLNNYYTDSLKSITSGTVYLEINTVGQCDNHTAVFQVKPQIPVTAKFIGQDTLDLQLGSTVSFTNISVNSNLNYWDAGLNQGYLNTVSPTFTYSVPGTYLIKLVCISTTGCTDSTASTLIVTDNPLVIHQLSVDAEAYKIRTLSNGVYNVQLNDRYSGSKVELLDQQGRLIRDYSVLNKGNGIDVDLSELNSGLYFLKVTGNDHSLPIHLLKQ